MTEENNPFKKERKTEEWPAEVVERLSMQAERTNESLGEGPRGLHQALVERALM